MMNKKIGFTIGKFAPFHKGHEYLIETALQDMDEFYIVVYDTPQFDIDVGTKAEWITKKFPNVKILKAFDSPKQYGLDEQSVKIQMEYLSEIIEYIPVNYFYSSEDYGKCVSEYLNIENVVVDKERVNYPVSARMIRDNKEKYKSFLDVNICNDLKEIYERAKKEPSPNCRGAKKEPILIKS